MKNVLRSALAGAGAGTVASVIQAGVGAGETVAFLPKRENADLAPRLVKRIAARVGHRSTPAEEWTLGTLYHLAYGAGWGALYGILRERTSLPPAVGGSLVAAAIYGITFPRFGGAVRMGVERPPAGRSRRMEFVLASITLSFGLATAYAYEAVRKPGPGSIGRTGAGGAGGEPARGPGR